MRLNFSWRSTCPTPANCMQLVADTGPTSRRNELTFGRLRCDHRTQVSWPNIPKMVVFQELREEMELLKELGRLRKRIPAVPADPSSQDLPRQPFLSKIGHWCCDGPPEQRRLRCSSNSTDETANNAGVPGSGTGAAAGTAVVWSACVGTTCRRPTNRRRRRGSSRLQTPRCWSRSTCRPQPSCRSSSCSFR